MTRPWLAAVLPVCSAALPALAAAAQAGEVWTSLWRTPDQRGQIELRAGNAAAAARMFTDPRRRAYAELQAGHYRAAAQAYAGLDDAESDYNRGNALARAGDLPQALQAYDAALAKDPGASDARHNRDLVARTLAQQHPQQQQQQANAGQGSSASPPLSAASGAAPQPGQSGSSPGAGKPKQEAQGRGNDAAASAATSTAAAAAASTPTIGTGRTDGRTPHAQASTRHDRAAAAAAATAASAGSPARGVPAERDGSPRSEQQLAEDQWLRRLPDDPGGLLRRKFLIQHLMHQEARR